MCIEELILSTVPEVNMAAVIAAWHEQFVGESNLAVVYENTAPNTLALSCGVGQLIVRYDIPPEEHESCISITSNDEPFMKAVANKIIEHLVGDESQSGHTGPVVSAAERIQHILKLFSHYAPSISNAMSPRNNRNTVKKSSMYNSSDDDSDDDESCSDASMVYYYESEDGDEEGNDMKNTTSVMKNSNGSSAVSTWLEEHTLKKRWTAREQEIRADRMAMYTNTTSSNEKKLNEKTVVDESIINSEKMNSTDTNATIAAPNSTGTSHNSSPSPGLKRVKNDILLGYVNTKSKKQNQVFSSEASSQILINDLLSFRAMPSDQLGYTVTPVDDNIYHWKVQIDGYALETDIRNDIANLDSMWGYSYCEIHLHFAMDLFPFYPPLVTIIRPRFAGDMLSRIAALKCLQLSYWDPVHGVRLCIDSIRHELAFNGSLVVDNPLNNLERDSAYSSLEHILLKLGTVCEILPRVNAIESSNNKKSISYVDDDDEEGATAREEGNTLPILSSPTAATDAVISAKSDDTTADKLDTGGTVDVIKSDCIEETTSDVTKSDQGQSGAKRKAWAKGTGYGHGSKHFDSWDEAAYFAAQQEKDRLQVELVNILLSHIKAAILPFDLTMNDDPNITSDAMEEENDKSAPSVVYAELQRSLSQSSQASDTLSYLDRNTPNGGDFSCISDLTDVISNSCLIPYLHSLLKTDSMIEVGEKHYDIFLNIFDLLHYLTIRSQDLSHLLHLPIVVENNEKYNSSIISTNTEATERSDGNSSDRMTAGDQDQPQTPVAASMKNTCMLSNDIPTLFDVAAIFHQKVKMVLKGMRSGGSAGSSGTQSIDTILALRQSALVDDLSFWKYLEAVLEDVAAIPKIDTSNKTNITQDTILKDIAAEHMDTDVNIDHKMDDIENNSKSDLKDTSIIIPASTVEGQTEQYISLMRKLQYDDIDEMIGYHYKSQASREVQSNAKERNKRLAKEHADLCTSLPLSWSSTVWMRVSSERMDILQAMISGPDETPYQNGLFIFDSYFPNKYPNEPPLINLSTTGHGSVRFNPNLYNCGKVCLSLLGTWSGAAGENWSSKTSTFLQVLVSIQSLILVPEPFF